jgi:hydrogenase expression/formation protein HypC
MCLGIPGEIVTMLDDELATVSVAGVERDISVGLLLDEGIDVGDWVLVHVGFALAKIDEAEAAATLDQIQRLGQAYIDEMDAYESTEVR